MGVMNLLLEKWSRAFSGLIEIVKFIREVGRIPSVKDSGAVILEDPDNAIGRAACGNAGSGTRIRGSCGQNAKKDYWQAARS